MFLAGYGLASFRKLVEYDLLQPLFPGTARALAALRNTTKSEPRGASTSGTRVSPPSLRELAASICPA